jgi:hypothetical protein
MGLTGFVALAWVIVGFVWEWAKRTEVRRVRDRQPDPAVSPVSLARGDDCNAYVEDVIGTHSSGSGKAAPGSLYGKDKWWGRPQKAKRPR